MGQNTVLPLMRKRQSRTERAIVRLTPEEKVKLIRYADSKGLSESQVIREYIRRLPSARERGQLLALPPAKGEVINLPKNTPIEKVLEWSKAGYTVEVGNSKIHTSLL